MQIELLWIIPVVAFAFFIFLLVYSAQKRSEHVAPDLAKEVNSFNNGIIPNRPVEELPNRRLNELEKSIITLTDSISSQQKVIDGFQEKNNANQNEVNELRMKLRDLYKEYDIIVSENYSLRAKVKKLQDKKSDEPLLDESTSVEMTHKESQASSGSGKTNLRLYEDTRLLVMNSLDDTSEIDLALVR